MNLLCIWVWGWIQFWHCLQEKSHPSQSQLCILSGMGFWWWLIKEHRGASFKQFRLLSWITNKGFWGFYGKTNNRNSPASQLAIFARLFVDSWLVVTLPTSHASSLRLVAHLSNCVQRQFMSLSVTHIPMKCREEQTGQNEVGWILQKQMVETQCSF